MKNIKINKLKTIKKFVKNCINSKKRILEIIKKLKIKTQIYMDMVQHRKVQLSFIFVM